tara:strand:+ start:632 stop:955 length:324 start_codon:yes stop_codon:yes gene_type:complete
MNINEDYQNNEEFEERTYEEEMHEYMGFLHEKLIKPMMGKLNNEELITIGLMGTNLLYIAKVATESKLYSKKVITDEYKELISDMCKSINDEGSISGDNTTYNVNRN